MCVFTSACRDDAEQASVLLQRAGVRKRKHCNSALDQASDNATCLASLESVERLEARRLHAGPMAFSFCGMNKKCANGNGIIMATIETRKESCFGNFGQLYLCNDMSNF